ncbi:MAG: MFS transporter [Actinomycetota bacterium]
MTTQLVSSAGSATGEQRRALSGIAISQLLVLTLWFSAAAVTPQLRTEWNLTVGEASWLTLAVQIGFVIGALTIAVTGVADSVSARRLFSIAALVGAVANGAVIAVSFSTVNVAYVLRFVTGFALAGVYPSGMKAMAGWFRRGRGMALGVLVGALTVGSAGPHLIRGIGLEWRGVLLGSTLLAVAGAVMMSVTVSDGPFEVEASPFSFRHIGAAVKNRGVRLSTYGYLGHMWELYAMWTWTAAFLAASAAARGQEDAWVPFATFTIIAIGGPASYVAGRVADRRGRTLVAGTAMAISGASALATFFVFGRSPLLVVPLFLVWGASVVADSAQFSTMVTETARAERRGTALTLQTGLGFLLTLVTIRGVPMFAETFGWQWAFPWLAFGPMIGIVAMVALRRSPESRLIAAGAS